MAFVTKATPAGVGRGLEPTSAATIGRVTGRGLDELVVVRGAVDWRVARRMAALINDAAVRTTSGRVVLDLTRSRSIDRVGTRQLVACRRRAAARGVRLVLRPSESVAAWLSAIGLTRSFELVTPMPGPATPLLPTQSWKETG